MMMKVMAGILLMCASPCWASSWQVGQDVTAKPKVVRALDAARAHWAKDPNWANMPVCDLHVTIESENPVVAARTDRSTCVIALNHDWMVANTPRWPQFCTIMVHEYGHILGAEHSYAAWDPVMRATDPPTPPECRRRRHRR